MITFAGVSLFTDIVGTLFVAEATKAVAAVAVPLAVGTAKNLERKNLEEGRLPQDPVSIKQMAYWVVTEDEVPADSGLAGEWVLSLEDMKHLLNYVEMLRCPETADRAMAPDVKVLKSRDAAFRSDPRFKEGIWALRLKWAST